MDVLRLLPLVLHSFPYRVDLHFSDCIIHDVGVDLSSSNVDTPLGRKSLRKMYDAIVLESPTLPPGVTLEDVYRDHPDAKLYTHHDDAELSANAIARLHVRLREHCDIMGVGLEGFGGKKDTAAEDRAAKVGEGEKAHLLVFLLINSR